MWYVRIVEILRSECGACLEGRRGIPPALKAAFQPFRHKLTAHIKSAIRIRHKHYEEIRPDRPKLRILHGTC